MTVEDEFKTEKYKYIMNRKQTLNENSFKLIAFFQGGLAALSTAQIYLINNFSGKHLSRDILLLSSYVVFGLFFILCLFSLLSLISGVLAWKKYKLDEQKLEDSIFKTSSRFFVSNLVSWYETYFIASIFVILIIIIYTYIEIINPLIRNMPIVD